MNVHVTPKRKRTGGEPRWPKTHESMLKRMWADGATATAIGVELGYSRNAILGKVHRLKLPSRRVVRRKAVEKRLRHSPRRVAHPRVSLSPKKAPPAPSPVQERQSPTFDRSEAWKALPGSTPVSVVDHVSGCRWPVGDPLSDDFGFCNEHPTEGSRYCQTHRELSTRKLPVDKPVGNPTIVEKFADKSGKLSTGKTVVAGPKSLGGEPRRHTPQPAFSAQASSTANR